MKNLLAYFTDPFEKDGPFRGMLYHKEMEDRKYFFKQILIWVLAILAFIIFLPLTADR